jgi:hypothetical protein
MRRSDTTKAIERFLTGQGVAYRIDWTRRHPRVEIAWHSRTVFISFSSTTCNRNAAYDAVTRLRRALNLVGTKSAA